jgi:GDP/UDP-N,N'-diacetylbacillosamine 2-epimerase (hydrolysing)
MHLSSEFGETWQDIEADGFRIDWRVESLLGSDSNVGIAKSIGIGTIGFADALDFLKPDLLVVLGDRFEVFAAVVAALVARIPVAHIHGGERSEGAYDEAFRHSITKMSHLHFVANEEYRRRVIQLGEDPASVFTVGGLGVDSVCNLKLLDRHELEDSLDFSLAERNLLVTFHPATLSEDAKAGELEELFAALEPLERTNLIFTMPNADSDGREIRSMIEGYVGERANARAYSSLGQLRYLSCIKHVDGVIGNSSSGLIEAPALGKGTVNIGSRQDGRLRASSVIDCQARREEIRTAIELLYSPGFQEALTKVVNPYGLGGASEAIVRHIESVNLAGIVTKSFHDQVAPKTGT